MTLAEIAALVGGTVGGDPEAGSVQVTGPATVDSRAVPPGGLYVAVVGARSDGHDFTDDATTAGAAAALVSRPVAVAHVLVPDVMAALAVLAHDVLLRLVDRGGLTVVGLTGSSGKTSTKDLLAAVLETLGPTVATEASFNNELGVPLTVLRVDIETRFLVLEMGARGAGHIAALCRLAPPRIGAVLNVGAAHAAEFGTPDDTARAKSELVQALPARAAGGVAVLNADDHRVVAMSAVTTARVVTFGIDAAADVRATDVRLDGAARPSFLLHVGDHAPEPVSLPLHGAHHVSNALAAASVAVELGATPGQVAAALAAATPRSPWRMEVTERADGVTVINDAYNANPDSMRVALDAVSAMGAGRRRWAVLGEMLELGAASTVEHVRVGRLAHGSGARVLAVGAGARGVHEGALAHGAVEGEGSVLVADVPAALELLARSLAPGDLVLVKASRGAGLERVASGLLAPAGSTPGRSSDSAR